jgi:hypothetical protein
VTYPIPRPIYFETEVRRSQTGLGLFAAEDIPKNRFVIEYWGKVVTDDEAQEVGGRYLFELENGKTILGGTRKNIARYANHACRPNCEVRIVGDRVYLYSTKRIKAGTEITYDYGEEYFDAVIKPLGCRCRTCMRRRKRKRGKKKTRRS